MNGFKCTAWSGSVTCCQLHLAMGFSDLHMTLLLAIPTPLAVGLFYFPRFSASCLCRHQRSTNIAELWVHWILSRECKNHRWLEKVSVETVALLCSQDLWQMQAEQKSVGGDSACWKSRVNSLYWIINKMCFTILILHRLSVSRLMIFPLIFCGEKNSRLISARNVVRYQWEQSECSVCRLRGCTGCFWLYKHAFFLSPYLESDILQSLVLLQLNLFQDSHWLEWYETISCSHMLKSNQCSMGTHTENKKKKKAAEEFILHMHDFFCPKVYLYMEDMTIRCIG